MTYNDGFDRTVSEWLTEQAGRGAPDYLDEVLARTTRTRQRPAWSSLERWLPVHRRPFRPGAQVGLAAGASSASSSRSARRPCSSGPGPGRCHRRSGWPAIRRSCTARATATSMPSTRPPTSRARSSQGRHRPASDPSRRMAPGSSSAARNRSSCSATTMVANADGSDIRLLDARGSWTHIGWNGRRTAPGWRSSEPSAAAEGTLDHRSRRARRVRDLPSSLERRSRIFNRPFWRPDGQELVFLANSMDNVLPVGLYSIQADGSVFGRSSSPRCRARRTRPCRPTGPRSPTRRRGAATARAARGQCRHRGSTPSSLHGRSIGSATAVVARWDQAGLRALRGRYLPPGRWIRGRWRRRGNRAGATRKRRWNRGEILPGRNQGDCLLQGGWFVVDPRSRPMGRRCSLPERSRLRLRGRACRALIVVGCRAGRRDCAGQPSGGPRRGPTTIGAWPTA